MIFQSGKFFVGDKAVELTVGGLGFYMNLRDSSARVYHSESKIRYKVPCFLMESHYDGFQRRKTTQKVIFLKGNHG